MKQFLKQLATDLFQGFVGATLIGWPFVVYFWNMKP